MKPLATLLIVLALAGCSGKEAKRDRKSMKPCEAYALVAQDIARCTKLPESARETQQRVYDAMKDQLQHADEATQQICERAMETTIDAAKSVGCELSVE